MRGLSGFLLLTAGLSVGAFAYYPTPIDGSGDIATLTRMMAPSANRSVDARELPVVNRTRLFSPQSPLVALEDPTRLAYFDGSAATKPPPKRDIDEAPGSWSVVVTANPAARSPHRRLTSSKPADAASHYELVRRLQGELKRVGCYEGEIDGDWGPGSKRAMAAFTDRVNASLPTQQPDYILLTLVQGHTQPACGATCPSGQSVSDSGRCVANTVVARATPRKPASPVTISKIEVITTTPRAPQVAVATRSEPAQPKVVARASPPPPAAAIVPQPAESTTVVAAAPAPPALPGRMSIGGPVSEPVLTGPPTPARRLAREESVASTETAHPASTDAPKAGSSPRRERRVSTSDERSAAAAKKKKVTYAGSSNRGAPRPGTPRYNLMLSLGGVF